MRFALAPNDEGTEVTVRLRIDPAEGAGPDAPLPLALSADTIVI